MNKIFTLVISIFFLLFLQNSNAATWEKLYVKKSTDCFRSVREVPSGGYIVAGYTSNFTPNDTDGLVLRMNTNGDTLWSLIYNGPSSKEDCFYKVLPTADNGFILCGYSRSFGSGENAFYMKLNSSGVIQWVKNWGGSGIERAQDIIELPDGKFVLCGYTTTAPAKYYDAFILKIDQNGNTLWSKNFGGTAYDDANSLKLLSDGGFIMGGQSNNQLYLIRTNSNGDAIWTQSFGTSGIDNIECVNFAQEGDGFILAGTTAGAGAGGEDGYLVKTDTGGVQIWAKTYGGSLNDGFHRIEPTSDGGYVGSGTSSEGPWVNPNIWLVKVDAIGTKTWEKFFGGNNHDHGYSGQQTSDGGYITVGHTHSFISNNNNEDAMVIKTNSSGVVTNELSWTTVTQLMSPVVATCGSPTAQIKVEVANYGIKTITSIPVTIEITGAITQTLTQTLSTSVAPNTLKTLTFTATVDMSGGGTFNFHCYTGNPHDIYPVNNYIDKSITVGGTAPPVVSGGSHCGPGTVVLSASSPTAIQWFSVSTGGTSLGTGATFTTSYLTSNTTYYAQSGGSCQSSRVPVNATITAGLATPSPVDGFNCGPGTVSLYANSAYVIKWYGNSTSTSSLHTGDSYTTPSLTANTSYYIEADDFTCTSNRVVINAKILSPPNNPVTVAGSHCGSGAVVLNATASTTVEWYDASSGGNFLGNGNSFTTPVISSTTTFYALANNGNCKSGRVSALATIASPPADPVTTSNSRCGTGTIVLTATGSSTIKWYDSASGGSQVGTGTSFTTPSISTTKTYYALVDNGCVGNRIPAIATINSIPAIPVTSPANRCGSGTLTLSATATNPIKWYSAATGGSSIGTGNTYTTTVISSTTTYYAAADDGCSSSRVPAVATINVIPAVPVPVSAARCSTGTVLLTATSSKPMEWYDAASGGNQVATGNSFTTPVLSSSKTYYILSNSGICISNRVPVVATIASTPPDPVTTSSNRCGQGTVTISATAANPIKWFDAMTGGSQVGSGSTFTTPVITTTKTYYAVADNVCLSNRIPAVATINAIPSNPVTTSSENCGNGMLVLTATSTNSVKWYNALSGGNQVGSGNTFTTPNISTTTTFYALADNGQCKSERIPAVAKINEIPANPVASSVNRCGEGSVVLTASSDDSLKWYDAATGGNLVGTGNSFTIPILSVSKTYYVFAYNDKCISNAVSVSVGVNPIPSVNLGDTIHTSAVSYILDAGAGFSSYQWSTSITTQTNTANSSGNYCVTVTDVNNCSASDCAYVEFSVGVKNDIHANVFNLYPNPSNGIVTIEFQDLHSANNFKILDITGKTILNKKIYSIKETIDLSFLSKGIYIIQIRDSKSTSANRLVIE